MKIDVDIDDKCPVCGSPLTSVNLRRKTLSGELVVYGTRYWCGASFFINDKEQASAASCTNAMTKALEMRKELDEIKRQTS